MINMGFISFDIILILIALAILFFIAFRGGKKPIVALTLSFYPSLLIIEHLPWILITDPTAEAVIFVLIYILSAVILWKTVHVRKVHSPSRKIIDYSLIILVYIILFFSTWFIGIPALQSFHSFEPQIVNLFSKIPFGLALILPLIILILTNRHDRN